MLSITLFYLNSNILALSIFLQKIGILGISDNNSTLAYTQTRTATRKFGLESLLRSTDLSVSV